MIRALIFFFAVSLFSACTQDNVNNACTKPGAIQIIETNSSSILFTWGIADETAWEIEYGIAGFQIGSGTVFQTSQDEFFIDNLDAATSYDLYLRTNCGRDGFSDRISTQFTTTEATNSCNAPSNLSRSSISATSIGIFWDENNETAWQIEYGLSGFTLGTGTVEETSQSTYTINNLNPSTTYEIYVRANCGSEGFSDYDGPLVITTDGN